MPALADHAREQLTELAARHRLRQVREMTVLPGGRLRHQGRDYWNFSGNDYFDLASHPAVLEAACAALKDYGAGSTSSRMVVGGHPLYTRLEAQLAEFHGKQAALVFGSGYMANLAISCLVGKGDLVLADRLSHACLLDGVTLSGAKLLRFHHQDVDHARRLLAESRSAYRHCLLVTESTFSMDGDRAPIAELSALAEAYDGWLMLDDAHGLGYPLSEGGIPEGKVDIHMGTLSKGLGSYGGYLCADRPVIEFLQSSARSQIFTTALPPATLAAASCALDILRAEPERSAKALALARQFTERLNLPQAASPIVPIVIGTEQGALEAFEHLKEAGFWLSAIRPPTVPQGTARLRATFSAAQDASAVEALAEALRPVLKALRA